MEDDKVQYDGSGEVDMDGGESEGGNSTKKMKKSMVQQIIPVIIGPGLEISSKHTNLLNSYSMQIIIKDATENQNAAPLKIKDTFKSEKKLKLTKGSASPFIGATASPFATMGSASMKKGNNS